MEGAGDRAAGVGETEMTMDGTSDDNQRPSEIRRGTKATPRSHVDARIEAWRASRNTVALGNLAEHVAVRLLVQMD